METKNKVWFVTGASKGMGLTLVKLLLSKGYKVAATSRNAADLEKQVGESGPNFLPLGVNIAENEQVKEAIEKTVETFGKLDVVVNNAGYAIYGAIEELSDQEFCQAIDVNLIGTTNVIRNAMPYLRKQESGHIINFSSSGGYKGYGSSGAYTAAKFAVIGLTECLADEIKHLGVNATVVAPGFFRTSFLDKGAEMYAKTMIDGYKTDGMKAWMQSMNGTQQGDPQKLSQILIDIAKMKNPPVHLLAGPDAYQLVQEKIKEDEVERENWKSLTFSTNLDD
ncbi:SDR family oxidoreductase [Sphingobacterium sp. Lzh-3]|uniref:SDR family oxidoreductase n=1 Tax=Sphingobacterium sp. Lzh-3 TaxID=3382150 RepID=UPI00398D168F